MQKLFEKSLFLSSIVLGLFILLPFIVLELINRWKFHEDFPYSLFAFAWLLQTMFIYVLIPIIQNARTGKSIQKHRVWLLIRIVALIGIAYIWGGWIVDQWPCLMGVPNCD